MKPVFLFIGGIGTAELVVMGVIGLLLFGRRLPEVGRSLGKTMLQFKSGLNEMKAEIYDVERMVDEHSEPVTRNVDPIESEHDDDHEQKETSPDEGDVPKN